ncbi:MAG: glycosyltransferase family protein, partial [Bdellovibrionales bacterium]|nr:glycosyltransferase family protein [Bdellovibrionales bacterium]
MIAAIVQARMGSSRLPGKVLLPLQGKPMLIQQLERVQRVKGLDQVIVATTTEPGDQVIVDVCREYGIACYRGSSSDVLDRYYQIAKEVGANEIIRVTADCPLLDPQVVDQLVEYFHDGEFDYAANNLRPTLPDGLDAEVFRFEVLEEAWKEAKLPSER